MADSIAGYFGKLPSYGDFVTRRLPQEFVQPWDSWLQNVLSCSREQLGEAWLDTYLTSPLWRFALSPNVLTGEAWTGTLMPSVDRVGRCFPFTIAVPVAADCGPMQLVKLAEPWFERLEEIALSALDDDTELQALDGRLEALGGPLHAALVTRPAAASGRHGKLAMRTALDLAEDFAAVLAQLMTRILHELTPAHGVWWTQGSERVEPSVLVTERLLPVTGFAALLDGDWASWGWDDAGAAATPAVRSFGGAGG